MAPQTVDALPQRLRRLAWRLERREIPLRHVERLGMAVNTLLQALDREDALRSLAGLLGTGSR